MKKDSLTIRLLLIAVGVIATYAAIVNFGFRADHTTAAHDTTFIKLPE